MEEESKLRRSQKREDEAGRWTGDRAGRWGDRLAGRPKSSRKTRKWLDLEARQGGRGQVGRKICSTRKTGLALGRNNSQGYCERLRYYHCSGRNNLAKTEWKTGVLILKTDETIDSRWVRRAGAQVSEATATTNQRQTKQRGEGKQEEQKTRKNRHSRSRDIKLCVVWLKLTCVNSQSMCLLVFIIH